MAVRIDLALSWLASDRLSASHAAMLLKLVAAVRRSGSLTQAARAAGISYRHAWGLLGEAAEAFGAPLVRMERGRGAQTTVLGEKILWADGLIRAAVEPHFARLRQQVDAEIAKSLPRRLPRLVVHASHDLALQELAKLCSATIEIELVFGGADESLAALANGRCDLAGFHVAEALPRAAAAAAALGRWLDPGKHQLIRFVTRQQGLIARPDSHIRTVHDFVPLALERYFLAFPRARAADLAMQRLIAILQSREFARHADALPGYDAQSCGRREKLDAALNWVERARRPMRRSVKR